MAESLGIPKTTWWATIPIPFTFTLTNAVNAVFAGACTTAVVYHSLYRTGRFSGSAGVDPFRARMTPREGGIGEPPHTATDGYALYAARYMHDYGAKKEYFGLVAINERTNASKNEHAVMRTPITMEDYLNARMIRWPLNLLDMDIAIDGADAVVVTTAERARDLKKKPVYVHAATFGQTEHPNVVNLEGLHHLGHDVVMEALWQKSDLKLKDMDIYFAYDGFTIITLNWLENAGWCQHGEAGLFLEHHWDKQENRVKINGRIPMNTHGGNLSEGATQGSGHVREAVMQLRGEAGSRQVSNCENALLTIGGMYFNSSGMVLRAD
jgi:acetyl-CoA acetyltransferase